jgi:glutaredoxin-related protein
MKKFFIYISIIILFCGCSSSNNPVFQSDNEYNQYIKAYQKTEIDSIIQHNDYTIIFGWTEWCRASHNELKKHLIPFLAEIPDNIGVVSICCGNADKVANFFKENDCKYPVFLLKGSWSGLDKVRLNRRFHALFNNYKSVNYVPIVILCNSQKQILNWDTINHHYDGISYSIHRIKNGIF